MRPGYGNTVALEGLDEVLVGMESLIVTRPAAAVSDHEALIEHLRTFPDGYGAVETQEGLLLLTAIHRMATLNTTAEETRDEHVELIFNGMTWGQRRRCLKASDEAAKMIHGYLVHESFDENSVGYAWLSARAEQLAGQRGRIPRHFPSPFPARKKARRSGYVHTN